MSTDRLLRRSEFPMWKYLTERPLTRDERVSLITDLFSDQGEISALKVLNGSDAQSVIDVLDEVLAHCHVRMAGPLT